MNLIREQLEQIGICVREYPGTWTRVVIPPIIARMVRIEDELR